MREYLTNDRKTTWFYEKIGFRSHAKKFYSAGKRTEQRSHRVLIALYLQLRVAYTYLQATRNDSSRMFLAALGAAGEFNGRNDVIQMQEDKWFRLITLTQTSHADHI